MKRILFGLFFFLACDASLHAQTPFYEGKTVRIIVGFSPGAAYDVWGRLLAEHWGKFIPGNPSFVVQNMTGGGSLIAANHVYNVAKPDGLTLGFVAPGLYIEQLAGRKEVQHDWLKFSHIGSPESTARIFFVRTDTGYKTIEDLRKAVEPPKCGATGVGTASYYWPKLLAEIVGFKLTMVVGYQGAADVHLAIEKGEMHCWGGTLQNYFGTEPSRTWAKAGFSRVLSQSGQKRDPRLADVPTIWELIDQHKTVEATKGVVKLMLAPEDIGRSLFGPPGIPADRVKVLREGFMKMMKDPDVVAEAQKRRFEPNPLSGDEIEGLLKGLVQPPEVVEKMKTFLQN
jgi:tripartite-type tricarboxylate transporter receptor subunit TctC